jgi:hypothetical protein
MFSIALRVYFKIIWEFAHTGAIHSTWCPIIQGSIFQFLHFKWLKSLMAPTVEESDNKRRQKAS